MKSLGLSVWDIVKMTLTFTWSSILLQAYIGTLNKQITNITQPRQQMSDNTPLFQVTTFIWSTYCTAVKRLWTSGNVASRSQHLSDHISGMIHQPGITVAPFLAQIEMICLYTKKISVNKAITLVQVCSIWLFGPYLSQIPNMTAVDASFTCHCWSWPSCA